MAERDARKLADKLMIGHVPVERYDKYLPDSPVVTNGRYQCWGCKNREGYTVGGLPICRVAQEIMWFVYEPCSSFKRAGDEHD